MIKVRPYTQYDDAALIAAAQDERIWSHQHCDYHNPETFKNQWLVSAQKSIADGKREVFVICDGDRVIGSTSFYDMDAQHRRLALGYTWFAPEYWGGVVNPTAKLFMLRKAFEEKQCQRVTFYVDQENERSQAAVLKLGAQKEGVLRKHIIRPDATIRDTVVFSIIDDEWPTVKLSLEKRLA